MFIQKLYTMKTRILIFTTLCLLVINLSAQDGYTVIKDSLQSDILKQNRKISIFLPEGYEAKDAKFPVIYVLDADGRDQHIVPTARFLFVNNKMPKAIVVGVFNIDRNHDFLPTSTENATSGGGAGNFLQFFKSELVPYINRKFKVSSFNVLVGHSFGGLFAMFALLNEPDLFNAYIAIDPNFWYDKKIMLKTAGTEFSKTKNWQKSLFITGREGDAMNGMAVSDMDSLLKSSAPKELDWKVVAYADEDHGSVPFKSSYDGLRFIFDIGGSVGVYPEAGIIPKGSSTYVFIENRNPNLRYTIDGSEPTFTSPLCKDTIKLDKACTLKVKTVSKKQFQLPSVTRIFAEGDFMNGQKSVKNLKPGLKYSYYEGVWDSLPDFSKLGPKKTGITDSLNINMALKKDSFGFQFEGYIQITEKALYNLWIVSDDGSKLYFNNQLLLNNDGLHGADRPAVKMLPLNPGYYPIRIDYFERTGDQSVTIGSVVGNGKPTPIPKKMLFYK
jgi:predicted alpha/beta superfamily hydrolase